MGKLAAVTCDSAKPNKAGDRLLGDGDGLFLRIRPNGTKTWLIEYEFKGTRRKYTIGVHDSKVSAPGESISDWLRHGRLTLTQARSIAGAWKAARRGGHDPISEWDGQLTAEDRAKTEKVAAAAAEAKQPTVREATAQFLKKHMAGKKSESAIRYRLERLVALIGDKKIRETSRQDVIVALERIAEGQRKGQTAKQLAGEILTCAKRLWRFAEAREWVLLSPIERLTRKDFDARPVKRTTTLRLDEVVELWKAIGNAERCRADSVTVAALKLLILTGQREREVTDAEWSELDLDQGLWKIPATRTKKGRAHLVHLSPEALSVLAALKIITGKSRFAFASPLKPKQPIHGRSVNNALRTMFERQLLPNVTRCTVHDLRRTLITRLPDLGFEPFLAHKIANHVLSGVMAHYNHNEYLETRKAALGIWAAHIREAASPATNVTPLIRKAAV